MAAVVVGRDAELASIRGFVAGICEGASALVLEGALEPLPAGQRSALARALVLEDAEGSSPDAHAVGVALLNAFRGLASTRDLLVAVDDVQWLDAASAAAFAYAARRLRAEHVGLLLARRSGTEASVLEELKRTSGCSVLDVGPLDTDSLHRLVQAHLGVPLPRPLLSEVHQASGGNPFFALEIMRTLTRSGVSVEAGKPLPVPDSLHGLVHGRLLALPSESRDFLAAAAAHAHPTISITEDASGVDRDVGLVPALEARVVETEDERIRFTHPLLAAGALETADSQRRAEIHARLAELLEDPEARAWQLAASVDRPDEDVAATLEDAARHARARGAPRPAALLLDRARHLTPADRQEEACRRAVDAAYLHYESGDSVRAAEQLHALITDLAPGRLRARALMRLARVRSYQAQEEATSLFLQAIEEADDDHETLAVAHEGVATCLFRRREQLEDAVDHAELAARLAVDLGDEALAAEALGSKLLPETLLGRSTAAETLTRALAVQHAASDRRVLGQPLWMASVYWWWTDSVERARQANYEALQRCQALGDESSRPYVLLLTAMIESLLGELEAARGSALAGQELARQSGQLMPLAYNLAIEALIEAQLGHPETVRTAADRALELVPTTAGRPAELVARSGLGHLALSLEDPDAADRELRPIIEFARSQRFGEPGALRFVVDHIEALIHLGRRDEAVELLDWYEGDAQRLERVSALANCLRCRGLLDAQAGQLESALGALQDALDLHARVELPLDRGRTLLALGAAQRRLKHRREARATLEEALAVFDGIGAALWAERARTELKRISGRAATPGALTPAEERVAALVAEGRTNREVAAALYLSDRTVEGHLSRVFGKLGIRHRADVGAALEARDSSASAEVT